MSNGDFRRLARRPGFRWDEETVLAVDVAHIDCVSSLARQARQLSDYPVGDLTCFNVDFSREFRYCLETGFDPTPASELSTLRLSVPMTETSNDVYGELSVADDTVTGSPTDILTVVQGALEAHDPDVLVCSTSEIVPTLRTDIQQELSGARQLPTTSVVDFRPCIYVSQS